MSSAVSTRAEDMLAQRRAAKAANTASPPPGRPFVWRDPATIPPRRWLYGRHMVRGFVSLTLAPGGLGKTALTVVEALALASGRALLDVTPAARCRVWLFNGEDPDEEAERRIAAAARNYGLGADDLDGWLFTGSGRETELIIAEQTREGVAACAPNIDAVNRFMAEHRIDVAIIDPFVSTHHVGENDNAGIDRVIKLWGKIAGGNDAALELVHHVRKPAPGADRETTVDDGRGASALLSGVRSARVLNAMTEAEAEKAGVDRPRSYFRVANGKANLSPPPDGATWYRFVSVELGNGDDVGVVTRWEWPSPLEGVKAADLLSVQRAIGRGEWRQDVQSAAWAGHAVAEALGLNVDDKKQRAKIVGLLKVWLASGALAIERRQDSKRMERPFVTVGRWADDEE